MSNAENCYWDVNHYLVQQDGDFYLPCIPFIELLMTLYDMISVWVCLHCARSR